MADHTSFDQSFYCAFTGAVRVDATLAERNAEIEAMLDAVNKEAQRCGLAGAKPVLFQPQVKDGWYDLLIECESGDRPFTLQDFKV